ncbi:DoxX family protein [Emticicia sp. BO119]|uniref:DoxX family protein n=1 Tax=Emticicia sp. BO119 TaxID=2757768 RepID=UPI0015F10F97|nr:DoxX family protein [Emticicia sp. BO119]MBA4851067.1 DoxX family protein [Emticicia sp. BO119]
MSSKTQKILATILMAILSFMLVMSGVMKITGGEQVVTGLTKAGYGSYIKIFGIAEILFVALLWIPRTYKVGFYFILSYLGGAAAVEVAGGASPVAFALIALAWIGFYLKDRNNFVVQ